MTETSEKRDRTASETQSGTKYEKVKILGNPAMVAGTKLRNADISRQNEKTNEMFGAETRNAGHQCAESKTRPVIGQVHGHVTESLGRGHVTGINHVIAERGGRMPAETGKDLHMNTLRLA